MSLHPVPELYFLHIPKTAGTSVNQILRTAYRTEESFSYIRPEQLVTMSRAQVEGYRYYEGHYATLLYGILGRDIPSVTILRDPFELFVSWVQFMARQNSLPHQWFMKGMRQFNQNPKWGARSALPYFLPKMALDNFQVRSLGLNISLENLPARYAWFEIHQRQQAWIAQHGMEAVLEDAKRRLDQMMVVGTVDRLEESVGLICDYVGIERPSTVPEARIAPGRTVHSRYRGSGEFSPELEALIDQHTAYDRELYAYANQLLDKQLAAKASR